MIKKNVYGEGNYEASRRYNKKTREFAQSGRVDEAARNAAPATPEQAQELEQAEQIGKARGKGDETPHDSGNPNRKQ